MLTVLEVIKKTTEFFAARGIESPRLNAELLVGHALAIKRMQLYLQFERPLTEPELEKIRPLVKRRSQREPLQYILGETEFAGLKLKVDRRALIPRPETEHLIELLVQRLAAVPPTRVLDLGTGTGAIALALASSFPGATVTAVDQSPDALALARENAERCGLSARLNFILSDWLDNLAGTGPYELIVSNPPYLTDAELQAAQPEVKDHEPAMALASGSDGMTALTQIFRTSRDFLSPGGLLACETGIAQHAALLEAATAAGYARAEAINDLSDRPRYLLAFV